MRIDWLDARVLRLDCPVCGSGAPKTARLSIDSIHPTQGRLTLVECPGCGSAFYDDLTPNHYEDTGDTGAVKFYVEQGAGVDVMLEPLLRFDPGRIRHYLEVGCGFGYSLDFTRFAFGWQVRGIDPSTIAAAGRKALGVEIIPAYLTRETDVGGVRFDLVVCSEVIEHVADPHDFLRTVGGVLADGGVLALTTPNALAIRPETPSAVLAAIASPGSHLILFTRESLEGVLKASGFEHVQVWEYPTTLHAVASHRACPVQHPPVLDRALYRRYLAERSASIPPETPLGSGFTYRLFIECVNAGDFAAAEPVFDRLRAAYATQYLLNLDAPSTIPATAGFPSDFKTFAQSCAFNLAGILYFRGIVAMNHLVDYALALEYFRSAARAGVAIRTALRSEGYDDGATENFVWLARIHAIYCLARLDPPAAMSEMTRLRGRPRPGDPPPELWQVPSPLVVEAGTQLAQILPEPLARSLTQLGLHRWHG